MICDYVIRSVNTVNSVPYKYKLILKLYRLVYTCLILIAPLQNRTQNSRTRLLSPFLGQPLKRASVFQLRSQAQDLLDGKIKPEDLKEDKRKLLQKIATYVACQRFGAKYKRALHVFCE